MRLREDVGTGFVVTGGTALELPGGPKILGAACPVLGAVMRDRVWGISHLAIGLAAARGSGRKESLADSRFEVAVGAGTLRSAAGSVVSFPHRWTPGGVTVEADFTGGHRLHLAAAGCVLNDVYREAATLGIELKGVRVSAAGGFDTGNWKSTGISYSVEVSSDAPSGDLAHLLASRLGQALADRGGDRAQAAETTATSVAERRDHVPGRHHEQAIPDRESRVGVRAYSLTSDRGPDLSACRREAVDLAVARPCEDDAVVGDRRRHQHPPAARPPVRPSGRVHGDKIAASQDVHVGVAECRD